MRQRKGSSRRASTGSTGPSGSPFAGGGGPAGDPGALLLQRWDELLRQAPADMGLTAAMGQPSGGPASDPISWLSEAAHVPKKDLEKVRRVRNKLAAQRPVSDQVIANALETLERALASMGPNPWPG